MSATIEIKTYVDYYTNGTSINTDSIDVRTPRKFNVELRYLEDLEKETENKSWKGFRPSEKEPAFENYQAAMIVSILNQLNDREIREEVKSSVLIFLPGLAEINLVKGQLERTCSIKMDYDILRVHSSLETHKNNQCLQTLMSSPQVGKRKIILSTNICESSITVPDVKIVIDSCMTKLNEKDQDTNWKKLNIKWASHENCEQRKGRAGRTADGVCYRLLPKVSKRLLAFM